MNEIGGELTPRDEPLGADSFVGQSGAPAEYLGRKWLRGGNNA